MTHYLQTKSLHWGRYINLHSIANKKYKTSLIDCLTMWAITLWSTVSRTKYKLLIILQLNEFLTANLIINTIQKSIFALKHKSTLRDTGTDYIKPPNVFDSKYSTQHTTRENTNHTPRKYGMEVLHSLKN